jgi:hypothetical protein
MQSRAGQGSWLCGPGPLLADELLSWLYVFFYLKLPFRKTRRRGGASTFLCKVGQLGEKVGCIVGIKFSVEFKNKRREKRWPRILFFFSSFSKGEVEHIQFKTHQVGMAKALIAGKLGIRSKERRKWREDDISCQGA